MVPISMADVNNFEWKVLYIMSDVKALAMHDSCLAVSLTGQMAGGIQLITYIHIVLIWIKNQNKTNKKTHLQNASKLKVGCKHLYTGT